MYGNGNLSPHFPYAAQIWAFMWKSTSYAAFGGMSRPAIEKHKTYQLQVASAASKKIPELPK